MKVTIENKRRENKPSLERHGWKWDFKVTNPLPNTKIYQNVKVDITSSDGDRDSYMFTESWPYKSNRKVTDSFLVPLDWRLNMKGRMKVTAYVWAKEGNLPKHFRQGKGADYWGNLYGSTQLLNPPEDATKREVRIEWDNRNETTNNYFDKGRDLTLSKNIVS